MRLFTRSWPLGVVLMACGRPDRLPQAGGDYSDVPNVALEGIFRRVDSVRLATTEGDPVGYPGALLVVNGRAYLADPVQSNVKIFELKSGRRVGTLGRVGNGPGEFRLPLSLASTRLGDIIVLDPVRRVLSRWDTAGHFLEESLLPGSFSGVIALRSSGSVLLPGYSGANDSSAGGVTFQKVLHEAPENGAQLTSSHLPWPAGTHPWSGAFRTVCAAWLDPVAVVGTMASNEVRFLNRGSGREWTGSVGASWYHGPDWPATPPKGDGVVDAMNAWSKQQEMLVRLLPFDHARFVAEFQGYDKDGGRLYSYILADTAGVSLAAVHHVTSKILTVEGSTAWGVNTGSDVGELVLETFTLAGP